MLSGFKNFLITFLVAALLFGLVGFFATKYVSGVVTDILDGEKDKLDDILSSPDQTEEIKKEPEKDPDLKVPDGNSFTMVFVATNFYPDKYDNYYGYGTKVDDVIKKANKEKDSLGALSTKFRYLNATCIVLVRADKENREYVACYISPETKVTSPSGDVTLGEAYGRYGMNTLCDYITVMTGLEIDYRFLIDGHRFDEFIALMDPVKFDLEGPIYSMGKYHVSFKEPLETETETAILTEPKETEKKDEKDAKTSEGDKDDSEKIPEKVGNSVVLKKGKDQDFNNYSVYILNTFKEFSAEDVEMKSKLSLHILKEYLMLFEKMKEDELVEKLKDITEEKYEDFEYVYSWKNALATDMKAEKGKDIHSMLEAIEYFDYSEMIYPGEFNPETKMYDPDVKTGFEFFKKYRQVEETPETEK